MAVFRDPAVVVPIRATVEEKKDEFDYSQIIKRLKKLLPVECEDKERDLEEVFSYLCSILYGDDLHQFVTYNNYRKFAYDALDELVQYVQKNSLEGFKEELDALRGEIDFLLSKREACLASISYLTQEKDNLLCEIEDLKAEKDALLSEREKVKNALQEYSALMKSFDDDIEVVWEPITENNPIYGITPNSISRYIKELKKAYMIKLGVSSEQCDSDFLLNGSGLVELEALLNSFPSGCLNCSIDYLQRNSNALCKVLKSVKLPRVINNKSNPLESNESSRDASGLLRELQYRRMVLEATSKQKIAESQLKSLVELVSSTSPEGYDFEQVVNLLSDGSTYSVKEKGYKR